MILAQLGSLPLWAVGDLVGHHRTAALLILAVTAPQRLPKLPDVPAFAELRLADITDETWNVIMLPANAPARIVKELHAAIVQAAGDIRLRARLASMEAAPITCTPEDLRLRLRAENDPWKDIVKRGCFVADGE